MPHQENGEVQLAGRVIQVYIDENQSSTSLVGKMIDDPVIGSEYRRALSSSLELNAALAFKAGLMVAGGAEGWRLGLEQMDMLISGFANRMDTLRPDPGEV